MSFSLNRLQNKLNNYQLYLQKNIQKNDIENVTQELSNNISNFLNTGHITKEIKLDIIIPFDNKDSSSFPYCINSTLKYIPNINRIFIISKFQPDFITYNERLIWKSEDSFQKFSFKKIENLLTIKNRTGWYFQQLIKLFAREIIEDLSEYYMVLDSDVVFYKNIEMFDGYKPIYNVSSEYHEPYFKHMNILHPDLKRSIDHSGICHYMIFNQKILNEIINKVENLHNKEFWEIFVKLAINFNTESGASEYEIYFHYINNFHNDKFIIRRLSFSNESIRHIKNERSDYDYVAYHAWIS